MESLVCLSLVDLNPLQSWNAPDLVLVTNALGKFANLEITYPDFVDLSILAIRVDKHLTSALIWHALVIKALDHVLTLLVDSHQLLLCTLTPNLHVLSLS